MCDNLNFVLGCVPMAGKSVSIWRWKQTAILTGTILILSGLFALAWNSCLIVFTRSLQVTEFVRLYEEGYAANVTDYDIRVADIFVRVPRLVHGSTIPVLVSIWHEQGTRLNSLKLVFSSVDIFSMSLEVPDGYPSLEFRRASDGKGVLFYVSDLGFQGTGTVTLKFFIEFYKERLDLDVHVQFTMQKDAPLTFSRQVAEAQVNTQTQRV